MEPVAIVGIGCRLPGDSDGPGAFWDNLLAGRDLIRETPPDRWNLGSYYAPDHGAAGRTYTRWGGFVARPDEFDALFFGISPREALRMDPQQRWLLETTWEALEDAGYPPASLAGTSVGVFVGISGSDYGDVQKRSRFDVDAYTNSGNALSIAANRISYLFDFRGPSFVVDTACSSSLVALHLACQALQRREAGVAIVAGVNSLFTPDLTIGFSKASMLSPDGRCKPFDASANGYVRAEGAVSVILRSLDEAIANGDRVYAVIRGTGVNQDGRTGSMTVPSLDQQMRLLHDVYAQARIDPARVSYVEAHGTGTPVGDPIEATALGRVLGCAVPRQAPMWIGSVKSNLGHLEPASGIVGLAKLALALHHRTIPSNLHFHAPNPAIAFDELNLAVPTRAIEWRGRTDDELYAGINSFGFGGTNAHAVLGSAPAQPSHEAFGRRAAPAVWTVSARSPEALRTAASRDAAYLRDTQESYSALVATVQRRRSHHAHRLAILADNAAEAAQQLGAWSTAYAAAGAVSGHAREDAREVVFVFSGQGGQWPGMGRELFERVPLVRATVERFDALMSAQWGRSLAACFTRSDDSVFQSDIGQPVLFALQVALARLLAEWGIVPACVLGHSLGEIAAAHVSGALSEQDVAKLIVERSRAQERTRGDWRMAAAGIAEEDARELLASLGGAIDIAAVNAPGQVTIAGAAKVVEAFAQRLSAEGRFVRLLPLPYAFHTAAMEPVRDDFLASVRDIRAQAATVPFVSTVTGSELSGEALGPAYWWSNLRQPVRFDVAVQCAINRGYRTFLEIGPSTALVRYIDEIMSHEGVAGAAIGTLKRDAPALRCLHETVARLHVRGVPLDWKGLGADDQRHRSFPTYPWQRQRFWAESEDARAIRLEGPAHPLLGTRSRDANAAWVADIGPHTHEFLRDHRLDDRAVFPAAGYVELMLAAIAERTKAKTLELRDVNFERVLRLDDAQLVETTFDAGAHAVTIRGKPATGEGDWQTHARAYVPHGDVLSASVVRASIPQDARELDVDALYARFARAGHGYGPAFRGLRWAASAADELWGRIKIDLEHERGASNWRVHPAILDAAFQLALASVPLDEERESKYLPVHIESVQWFGPAPREVLCRVSNIHHQDVRSYADVELFTVEGELLAILRESCCLRRRQGYRLASSPVGAYREDWIEAPPHALRERPEDEVWCACGSHDAVLLDALFAQGLCTQPSTPTTVPQDATRVLVCAWSTESSASRSESILRADWELVQLAQALSTRKQPMQLLLVTRGATWGQPGAEPLIDPGEATLVALLRTFATELPHVSCRLLDLDPSAPADTAERIGGELLSDADESEVSWRGGRRFVQRVRPMSLQEVPARMLPASAALRTDFHLRTTAPGTLDELHWVQATDPSLGADEVEIEVRAAALNFRDVLKALDIYPLARAESRAFGDECAGVVRRVGDGVRGFAPGDPVVAVAPGSFGSVVRVHALLVAKKPGSLTFEQAASLPIAYLTAEYALDDVARLSAGESVLVHAAAGGVGLAAIQVAQRRGAVVLGTASAGKHELLRDRGVAHVFSSRDLSFVDGVRDATAGQGVDVVLNSLSGAFLARSLELLKPLGRFVEIGKKDVFANEALLLHAFRAGASFHAVDLARVMAARPEWVRARLARVLDQVASGAYGALPIVIVPSTQIDDAFRRMAQGGHVGKIVITFDRAERPRAIRSVDGPPIRADGTYVVTGGLSGFGWATARWLVEQGARTLVLASRSGSAEPVIAAELNAWRADGIDVRIVRCDVARRADVSALIDTARAGPPLRGVFHSAMVLHDELLANAHRETFVAVLAPKVDGAWNLHLETESLDLDHFVLYSSCATLLGSGGQAAYVAANRFVEALAEFRKVRGLPAMAIGWGPLADFGVVAQRPHLARHLQNVGMTAIAGRTVFDWMRFLLRRDVTTTFVMQPDWQRFAEVNTTARASDRLSTVIARGQEAAGEDAGRRRIAEAPASERLAIVTNHLRSLAGAVLQADAATLDGEMALSNMGLDSLMAFELKTRIEADLGVTIALDRLAAGDSLDQLAGRIVAQFGEPQAEAAAPRTRAVARIVGHDDRDAFRIVRRSDAAALEALQLDAAALTYLPDKLQTIGGLTDAQMHNMFGREPFVSNYFETPFGRIGAVTLPVRSGAFFKQEDGRALIVRGLALARSRGARCLSLTGLIPSATEYGAAIARWEEQRDLELTTGHATTTAAVVQTIDHVLRASRRVLAEERVAVLGVGSIGQSCLRLMLTVLPHPRELVLCDLFTRERALQAFAQVLRSDYRFHGPIRVVHATTGAPDEVYAAGTIIGALSAAEVLDVERLQPGTIVVDDSYPPAFSLDRAIRRIEERADVLFTNAGMLRLPAQVPETFVVPDGAEATLEAFGIAAFRQEVARDPRELTACVLSSALTASQPGFPATLGLATLGDLVAHYRGLQQAGIAAARLQCENYFVPPEVVTRFAERYGVRADAAAAD